MADAFDDIRMLVPAIVHEVATGQLRVDQVEPIWRDGRFSCSAFTRLVPHVARLDGLFAQHAAANGGAATADLATLAAVIDGRFWLTGALASLDAICTVAHTLSDVEAMSNGAGGRSTTMTARMAMSYAPVRRLVVDGLGKFQQGPTVRII